MAKWTKEYRAEYERRYREEHREQIKRRRVDGERERAYQAIKTIRRTCCGWEVNTSDGRRYCVQTEEAGA